MPATPKLKTRLLLSIAAGATGAAVAACSSNETFQGFIVGPADGGTDAAETGPVGTAVNPPDGGTLGSVGAPLDSGADAPDAADGGDASDTSTADAGSDAKDQ